MEEQQSTAVESVSGRSPVVWKQMVPSADRGKVCVSSRSTAAMMTLSHGSFLHTNTAVQKICSPLTGEQVKQFCLCPCAFAHILYFVSALLTVSVITNEQLLTDSFLAHYVPTCWNVGGKKQNSYHKERVLHHIPYQRIISPVMRTVQLPVFEFALVLVMCTPACGIWWSVTVFILCHWR